MLPSLLCMWWLCVFCFVTVVILALLVFGSALRSKVLRYHLGYLFVGIVGTLHDV